MKIIFPASLYLHVINLHYKVYDTFNINFLTKSNVSTVTFFSSFLSAQLIFVNVVAYSVLIKVQ